MKNTTNTAVPYPEQTDVADMPAAMWTMALGFENTWAGVWTDYTPVITQFAAGQYVALTMDPAATRSRLRVIGKTVFLQSFITVLSNPAGGSGLPIIFLPAPVAQVNIPVGIVTMSTGGAVGASMAYVPNAGGQANNTGACWGSGSSANRAAGDWFGLLFRYETV